MGTGVSVVWFKRDLRLADHAALTAASAAGTVLPLVIVEPEYWRLPDVSHRQYAFLAGCIEDLAAAIAAAGGRLLVCVGPTIEVLEALRRRLGGFALWSHEETGNRWTHARDRAVRRWARAQGVAWTELRQFGVIRGPALDRDRWAAQWDRMMAAPSLPQPRGIAWAALPEGLAAGGVPAAAALGIAPDGLRHGQAPGRAAALETLGSFLAIRGEDYTRAMSSPVSGEAACSRLSPYLAYGCVSIREAAQAAWRRQREVPAASRWGAALRSFIARLHWHCHFIQKLEAEPEAEWRPFARIYEGMRPPADPARLAAWAEGRTGYPFIDAAMRYLAAQGWINFRMRAMLMSFASHDLFLPWQESGLVLARLFTDYEPGIHWPQCQMQSGETGINTVRVYSPVKQGHDQDPAGGFIRRHVPELAAVAGALVHEPWRLDAAERARLCPAYPARIVIHEEAARAAKAALFARRQLAEAQREADAVQRRHGSRRGRALQQRDTRSRAAPGQLVLDLDGAAVAPDVESMKVAHTGLGGGVGVTKRRP